MQKHQLYHNDWLAIHPYRNLQSTDAYFVALANRLLSLCSPLCLSLGIPLHYQQKLSLYAAAYLEDVISELHLWHAFTARCASLYGRPLPFYDLSSSYEPSEINEPDVHFLVWNTLQSAHYEHAYFHPYDETLAILSRHIYAALDAVYETAPSNAILSDYLYTFSSPAEATHKLSWLFAHTYLTEPSVHTFQLDPGDEYAFTSGPLALFLREWLEDIPHDGRWDSLPQLHRADATPSAEQRMKNAVQYELFLQGTGGRPVAYLQGYPALHHFLTSVLQWPDDADHTLPGMQSHADYALMAHREKGLLLAPDVCAAISAPDNPCYDPRKARRMAFSLLTEPGKCPADLLHYLILHGYLPDAHCPSASEARPSGPAPSVSGQMEKDWVGQWMDFIARQSLGYYCRAE